ncbi:hypothetical protein KORDIASMS9_03920 [Kordia sp. SMS9]|uniref:hypothetical protein n=1 Tax=Kordia sp. SMS9 TaxID=2282170 RepID=UPI000E0D199D|nr:hypothetical protein [Kordia sp. SMS9]AXG71663.1 hypothetical protein KORDIASMS9_03920 [Kordia sp. SMS9]
MKPLKKSIQKFLKSRARWNQKIQSNAINDEDVALIVNTSILGELCYVFLEFDKPLHFQLLDVENLLETASNLFFEYLCLERKYQPELYAEAHADLVEKYQVVLRDMYKGNPTLATFSLISIVSLLQKRDAIIKAKSIVSFVPELFTEQPREAIEASMDLIFFQTNFGLRTTTKLDEKCIKLLEKYLLEAIKEFDFLFVSRILRTLAYVNAPESTATKKAIAFLLNYRPRRINLILEIVTEKGRQRLDEDTEMVKLNKEIMIAVLEWETDFRFYRDLGIL